MKESYSKNYFEKYAALTLNKILKISSDYIIQADRPDLRIPKINFGIEVTQALTPAEAIADIKKPLYTNLKLNPFDHNQKDLKFVIKKIDHAIKRKEEKSKYYDSYIENGLYIFSHCHNLSESMLINYFNQNIYPNRFFQHIFINCIDHIYHYYCFDKKIIKINYDYHELTKMNQIALEFEKHCNKKHRKIEI
ncbi:MAG: hypothetical protein ACLR9T_11480 [Thomasclavelia sp.]|uniref:hypothetical protein n=1 Tax=Thomasclavelia sp. TaxID=3025757 RepID=UPI0039A29FCC